MGDLSRCCESGGGNALGPPFGVCGGGRFGSFGDSTGCLVPGQGPTWLGPCWAWEEALGTQKTKV